MSTTIFNKSVVFVSPIEDVNTLCKSGTIINDTIGSFVNTVLYALSNEFISEKDENKRITQIDTFKNNIFNEIYKTDINYNKFKSDVKTNFLDILTNINSFLKNEENNLETELKEKLKIHLDIMNIIFELININNFEKIINKVIKKWEDYVYVTFRKDIMIETIKFIDYIDTLEDIEAEKIIYIKKYICYLIDLIMTDVNLKIVEPSLPTKVTPIILNIILKHFDCDIYFIDAITKYPKYFDTYKETRSKISIIILSYDDDKHFEIIGRCLGDSNDTKIQRQFKPYDELIKSIHFFLDNK